MRKVLYCLVAFAFSATSGALNAQGAGAENCFPSPVVAGVLSSRDADKVHCHDRPIGGIQLKLATSSGTSNPSELPPPPPPPGPTPTPEGEELPPIEQLPPPPPPEEWPTFVGETVQGKVCFLLDASGSMAGSRIATVRAEATATITELTEDHEIDCVAYGSQFPAAQAYSAFMWGTLLPCTEGNKAAAIAWINGPTTNPGGGTPTYACLQKSCEIYPSDLNTMFLLTDGMPNVSGSASQILADFPGWWAKFEDCNMVAICIGGNAGALDFMISLAGLAGGKYIAI